MTAPTGRAKGGHARAEKLSPERRSEIARMAAEVRHKPAMCPLAPDDPLGKRGECESPRSCEASKRCWKAHEKPHLVYMACYRGSMGGGSGSGLRLIEQGPLKGCHHLTNSRSIFKAGRGYVLEFCLAIRVRL